MTKNQKKHIARIWIGSILFHSTIDLEVEDSIKDMDDLNQIRKDKCKMFLKNDPAIGMTDEIVKYVKNKYK